MPKAIHHLENGAMRSRSPPTTITHSITHGSTPNGHPTILQSSYLKAPSHVSSPTILTQPPASTIIKSSIDSISILPLGPLHKLNTHPIRSSVTKCLSLYPLYPIASISAPDHWTATGCHPARYSIIKCLSLYFSAPQHSLHVLDL